MIDATLVKSESFKSIDQKKSLTFTVPTVGTSSESDEIRFAVPTPEGVLQGIRINNASTNFSISLRTKSGVGALGTKSIYEFLLMELCDREVDDQQINAPYTNDDTTESSYIYGKIKNLDGSTATGTNTIEMIISQM